MSEMGPRSRTFVLVLMEWDHSGVQKIWGPFATEADAREAETILTEYGLSGLWKVEPLLPLIGGLR